MKSLKFKSQRGTILIIALFVMVLLEVIVAALVVYHRVEIRFTQNFMSSQKMIQLAYGGEAWAKTRIAQVYDEEKNLDEDYLKITIPEGFVESHLMDMQGHFNVNNLIKQKEVLDSFKNMMAGISPQESEVGDEIIQYVSKRWTQYLSNGLASTQSPLNTITELRPLKGINAEKFKALLPNVFALPGLTPLNVNTATEYSIMSLSPNITKDIANSILRLRENSKGFKQKQEFLQLAPLSGIQIDADQITVFSEFYLSQIRVNYHNTDLRLYSLLRVQKRNNKTFVQVYWRSFGTI